MNSKLNLNQSTIATPKNIDTQRTSRRCFLKKTAAFTGLLLSPLKLASDALAADQQMEYLVSNMSAADRATAAFSSSAACSSAFGSLANFNGDHTVDQEDLEIFTKNWLSSSATHRVNIDGSHTYIPGSAGSIVSVDNKDFALFQRDWLKTHCSASSTVF